MLTINKEGKGLMGIVFDTYEHNGVRYAKQWLTDREPTPEEWELLECGVSPSNEVEEYEI